MNSEFTTNQDIIELLSRRIKEYRLAARISQKEMAEKSGISLATISHFEQGVSQNLTLNNLISILQNKLHLHIHVEKIIYLNHTLNNQN